MAGILYSTELFGLSVYDVKERRIGRVRDAALLPSLDTTRVDRYFVGGGWSWMTFRYDQVRSISLRGIYLRDETLTPYHSDEDMLRIERDLLDQQIIDAHGRKVVRINDITFDVLDGHETALLVVREVDIGVRSIFRRLVQGVLPPRWVRRLQEPIAPNSIIWEFCNVIEPDPRRRVRLNLSVKGLEEMHPADLADIMEDLGPAEREAILETIDSEVAADVLTEVEPGLQARMLESLETERAAEIIDEMSPSEAAHILAELEEETSAEILEEMHGEEVTEVRELLEQEEGTAGFLMRTDYLGLPASATVADAVSLLRLQDDLEGAHSLFLLDSAERFVAIVPLSRLLLASEQQPLLPLRSDMLLQVDIQELQERVVELFDKYNLLSLPVRNLDGSMAGVIMVDDVISALRGR